MPLREALQECVVCREAFVTRARAFQRAQALADPGLRAHATEPIRLAALKDCDVKPLTAIWLA